MAKYLKSAAMSGTSTIVMFGLMYRNTHSLGHVFFSETRAYIALLMGATMAAFMLGMYANKSANAAIIVAAVTVFAGSL